VDTGQESAAYEDHPDGERADGQQNLGERKTSMSLFVPHELYQSGETIVPV
jgi:hypothetical protein